MTATTVEPAGSAPRPGPPAHRLTGPRAPIAAKTLRPDRWWLQPAITFSLLMAFIIYSTFRAFQNKYYFSEPYISPMYSPCLTTGCAKHGAPHLGWFKDWWILTPAIFVLIFPLGFRLTCYYYRKAYYRSFWLAPAACAVREPHPSYSGETRFPLILQNIHRYFFYMGVVFVGILTWDAVLGFRDTHGHWGHMGLGTIVLIINVVLLAGYTFGCHSCRNIIGGRLKHFSKHPVRYRGWMAVSRLNSRHMEFAWASLIWVAMTDLYVWLVSANVFSDPRFF